MFPAPPWMITLGFTIGMRGGGLYSMLIWSCLVFQGVRRVCATRDWMRSDKMDLICYLIGVKSSAHFSFCSLKLRVLSGVGLSETNNSV